MLTVPEAPDPADSYRLVDRVVRRIPGPAAGGAGSADVSPLVDREWLVTNGLGGYASASVAGLPTRKYHGVLVAALPNPLGRIVMLNHLVERVTLADGTAATLSAAEPAEGRLLEADGPRQLVEFRLDAGLPVWTYRVGAGGAAVTIEKRLLMLYRQNSVYISYTLAGDGPAQVELRPALDFRGYEADVTTNAGDQHYRLGAEDEHYVVTCAERADVPPLRLGFVGAEVTATLDPLRSRDLLYRVEEARGYADRGALWSPGHFAFRLMPGAPVTLVASTESADVMRALSPADAAAAEHERRRRLLDLPPADVRRVLEADPRAAELVFAADQFLITPAGRLHDRVRAQAVGDEVRTVIAGYHWFTDWGRDTMISLEGLTLTTGRWREAGFILRTFAQYVRDGLIPNMFPDGSNEGLYHTADATLWFFHALDRYARVTGDRATVRQLLPVLQDVIAHHLAGTRFGIGVDPADGLLREGAEGYQLTWMDAKVDGWVVTPRRGKPVEINALWYNALANVAAWTRDERGADAAALYEDAADRARDAFNARFWYDAGGYLYDVVDGPDGDSTEFRPNQVLAVSLPNPVLDRPRWDAVLGACEAKLLTPYGLRSLAPGSPDYKAQYFGNLRARDAAYHQGTVWGWLIGPWVDAWRKLHPGDDAGARRFLDRLLDHLGDFGVGSVAEVFDAEAPYTPRGCIAQAWSVAELLRCAAACGAPAAPDAAPATAPRGAVG
ncbi:glycogen debranching protein [Gemmatimonadetes bacterium T265]|nr:glycogen debranching protein [Gemmatimonadetes bacterium T265]